MKVFKSLFLAILVFSTVFTSNIFAQGNEAANKQLIAEKAYKFVPKSLDSNIPGIVESTIYNLVEIKKYYPAGDYTDIVEQLNNIAKNYPDTSIRIKAYLASFYLGSSNIIDVHPTENYDGHDYLFKQIAEQIENKLLVSK